MPDESPPVRQWIGGRLAAPCVVHDRAEPYRPDLVIWMELPDHVIVGQVSTVAGKGVILDRTATTTCRGCMSGHRRQEPVWTSVRGADVKAVSPAERGRSEATGRTPHVVLQVTASPRGEACGFRSTRRKARLQYRESVLVQASLTRRSY